MSTRSAIAVSHNGIIKAVYCHNDGYVSYNGKILQENYDSVKANKLVALGNLSVLAPRIDPTSEQHNFATPEKGTCVFYGRDRKEEDVAFQTFQSREEYVEEMLHMGCEYFYMIENGVWYVAQEDGIFYSLVRELAE